MRIKKKTKKTKITFFSSNSAYVRYTEWVRKRSIAEKKNLVQKQIENVEKKFSIRGFVFEFKIDFKTWKINNIFTLFKLE